MVDTVAYKLVDTGYTYDPDEAPSVSGIIGWAKTPRPKLDDDGIDLTFATAWRIDPDGWMKHSDWTNLQPGWWDGAGRVSEYVAPGMDYARHYTESVRFKLGPETWVVPRPPEDLRWGSALMETRTMMWFIWMLLGSGDLVEMGSHTAGGVTVRVLVIGEPEKHVGTAAGAGHAGWKLTHRHIVRGHPRTLPSGETTWVKSYIKGPKGAPMRTVVTQIEVAD